MNPLDKSKEQLIRELQERDERYCAIFDESPIAIELYDADGDLVSVNNSCLDLFGVQNVDEIRGFSLFADPNIDDKHKDMLNRGGKIRFQCPFDFQKVKTLNLYRTSRHGTIWLDVLISPLGMNSGKISGFLRQISDITDRKLAGEALRNSEEQFRNLYNEAPVGLYRTTPDGKILLANRAIYSMLGFSDYEDLTARNLEESGFEPTYHRQQFIEQIEKFGEVRNLEAKWICRNGDAIIVRESAKVIRDKKGNPLYYDGTVEDITARKRADELLNEALEKAEAGNRLKTAFMNNISHEVRTPLNGILGFADLLDDPDLTPDDRTFYKEVLIISSERLLKTINSYMDISLIVSGNMRVSNSLFDLKDLCTSVYSHYKSLAPAKGYSITIDLPETSERFLIDSDPDLVRKVLDHLLENAVKFAEFGTINMGYRILPDMIEVFVQDSGIGINEKLRDQIFDSFLQADVSYSRKYEGSGLGLAIAKGLVELIGGRIWVKSIEGAGSTFGFTIPVKPGRTDPDGRKVAKDQLSGEEYPVVLIAEDDPINILYLESVLNKCKASVWHVENGKLAVEFCYNHPELSVVLMDLKMPVMDGLEATRLIKKFRNDLKVIAVTAFAMPGDRERAIEAGCDDYMSKPFTADMLKNKLREYIRI